MRCAIETVILEKDFSTLALPFHTPFLSMPMHNEHTEEKVSFLQLTKQLADYFL